MINHTVLFKLKDFDNEDQKGVVRHKLEHALLALTDKIPEHTYLEVGENLDFNAAAFDICLVTHFETISDLEIYRVHPEHLKVVELVKTYTKDRAVVDYEF